MGANFECEVDVEGPVDMAIRGAERDSCWRYRKRIIASSSGLPF